jgi:hypothetical protein
MVQNRSARLILYVGFLLLSFVPVVFATQVFDAGVESVSAQSCKGLLLLSNSIKDADVLAESARENICVLRYDPGETTLETLADRVSRAVSRDGLTFLALAVHDIGHGKFYLTASETVNLPSTLGDQGQRVFWKALGNEMAEDGRIDILACSVASGDRGQLLVAALEEVSGVSVAASDDPTGNPAAGGDWVLETANVDVADLYFNSQRLKKYTGLLASQIKKLEGSDAGGTWDGREDDYFGTSVAIDGAYAIVGAPEVDEDVSGNGVIDDYTEEKLGQAYLFKRDQGGLRTWAFKKKLRPASIGYHDGFGEGVAINMTEGIVVVGAPYRGTGGGEDNPGVYVFRRDKGGDDSWGEQCVLTGDSSTTGFGENVDISSDGSRIIVGARKENIVASPNKSGAAYIFEKGYHTTDGDDYGRIKKIEGIPDSDMEQFGDSVAIDGDYAVVGMPQELVQIAPGDYEEPGCIYIYKEDEGGANNWGQIKHIHASDWGDGHNFGDCVSISGNYLAVGADGHDSNRGAVYIFKKDTGGIDNFGELTTLTGEGASDRFGSSVDIRYHTLLVGAEYNDTKANQAGAAYLHAKDQGGADNWGQVEKALASDGAASDRFGSSVCINSGYEFIVSSLGDNSSTGSAYIFDTDTWWPGPDAEGYTGETVNGNWESIASTGTEITFADPEDGTYELPIGFTFPFYSANYTTVHVSVNGFLTFDTPYMLYYSNYDLPGTSAFIPGSMIAPWWDDLSTVYNTAYTYVRYQVKGTAPNRYLIVHWRVEDYMNRNSSPLATLQFMAKLYETTGRIIFAYYDTDCDLPNTKDNAKSATVGIQNPAGTQTVRYSYNGSRSVTATGTSSGTRSLVIEVPYLPFVCPSYSGPAILIENQVFPANCNCSYVASTSITTGNGVVIEPEGTLNLTAPTVTIGPGLHAKEGANLNMMHP